MLKHTSKMMVLTFLIGYSCVAQKTKSGFGELKGVIGIYKGNCMPQPGVKPCEPEPVSTTILISSLTDKYDETLIIKQLKSDENGQYQTHLPAGKYSLFLKDGDKVVCTLIQCPETCICHPFRIASDSVTIVDANLDHANW